jgi:chromosome segregation ATPase
MDIKKIDIKTWFIIILAIGLIISFIFNQKNNVNYHKDEIDALHKTNSDLLLKNDSLKKLNNKLDSKIAEINILLYNNNKQISEAQAEINRLKNKRNEIPNYVNGLSANDVANDISKYLETTKNTNSNKLER